MRYRAPHFLPILLAAAGLTSAAAAQANATTGMMTYGDELGASSQAVLTGATPNVTAFILPSLVDTGSNYLVGLSGDADDFLTVGIDQASQGTYFQGTTDANGRFAKSFTIPNQIGLLDRKVYWQGFTRPGGVGVDLFQDFSRLRIMTLNQADRWQAACANMPVASANLAFAVSERGENGLPTRVFVCGGGPALLTDPQTPYPTIDQAWTYDLTSESFELHAGGMTDSRAFHKVTQMSDGRFLVTGGVTFGGQSGANYYTEVLNSAEIFDPATDTFTLVAPMNEYRAGHTSTLLPDGRVLVTGGTEGDSNHRLFDVTDILGTALANTEVYNPATNQWTYHANLPEPKAGHSATVLNDGRILMAGGITHITILGIPIPDFSNNAAIYNTGAANFSSVTMRVKRALFATTTLLDGRVVLAGGGGGDIFNIGPIAAVEIFDPATDTFTRTSDLPSGNVFAGAVTLPDGRAAIIGGATGTLADPIPIKTVSHIDPVTGAVTAGTPMSVTHGGGVTVLTEDGIVLMAGGESDNGTATVATETCTPD